MAVGESTGLSRARCRDTEMVEYLADVTNESRSHISQRSAIAAQGIANAVSSDQGDAVGVSPSSFRWSVRHRLRIRAAS